MNPSSPSAPVAEYTARGPYTVGPKEPLDNARRLMEKYELEDLPVRAGGKVVGLLSARELRLVWALVRPAPQSLTVEDAMESDPYTVTPDTPLDEVVRAMTARRAHAAVVLDGGMVFGVFAVADAMRALADALAAIRTARRGSGAERPVSSRASAARGRARRGTRA